MPRSGLNISAILPLMLETMETGESNGSHQHPENHGYRNPQ